MIKKVLNEWGKFLQVKMDHIFCSLSTVELTLWRKTPESAQVLGSHKLGWFGETGLGDLVEVANAPEKSNLKFEEMFECDPSATHYGFKSWDGK